LNFEPTWKNSKFQIPNSKFQIPNSKFQIPNSRRDTLTFVKKQKAKYGKRYQKPKSQQTKKVIPASAFEFDPTTLCCRCPAGNEISFRGVRKDSHENERATFEGRLNQCRYCEIKERCMKNPSSTDHRKGAGRQVPFALTKGRKSTHTDWVKHRIDSEKGKLIYSHRMSVVEPVFANIGTQKRLNRFSLRGRKRSTVNGSCIAWCITSKR
jgi:hypothetical protein